MGFFQLTEEDHLINQEPEQTFMIRQQKESQAKKMVISPIKDKQSIFV